MSEENNMEDSVSGSKRDQLMEEYKQLRGEIMHYLSGWYKNFSTLIAVVSGGFGIIFFKSKIFSGQSNPSDIKEMLCYLSLILSLLAFYLAIDETLRLKTMYRISAYIQVYIESELTGLNWETYISTKFKSGKRHKFGDTLSYLLTSSIFTIFYFGSGFLTLILLKDGYSYVNNNYWEFLTLFILPGIYLLYLMYSTPLSRNRYLGVWEDIKNQNIDKVDKVKSEEKFSVPLS